MIFTPQLKILQTPQLAVWQELRATPKKFVLYGGTALALRLGHRVSEDFDFFTNSSFAPQALLQEIPCLHNGKSILLRENTLTCVLDRHGPVSISFFGGLGLKRVMNPDTAVDNGVQVASLLDVAGCKMAVVQKRAEGKGYRDISALLEYGIGLPQALAAAKAIHGGLFDPRVTLHALTYFADGDLSKLPLPMQDFLRNAANSVKLEELPALMGKPGLVPQGEEQ